MFYDTNILIDYLNGEIKAKKEIEQVDILKISIIVWMEVLAGCDESSELRIRRFLDRFEVFEVDWKIANLALKIRKTKKMKLPDCIILATALENGSILVTRNTKDFDSKNPQIRVPYKI